MLFRKSIKHNGKEYLLDKRGQITITPVPVEELIQKNRRDASPSGYRNNQSQPTKTVKGRMERYAS